MCARHMTLIERMGGAEAASGLLISSVELFYFKLTSDPALRIFFEGVDTELLKRKQVDFLAYVFGGPNDYQGKALAEAHERLIREKGLDETHFDIVAAHFRDTLIELSASTELVEEAMAILGTARPIFERTHTALPPPAVPSAANADDDNVPCLAGQLEVVLKVRDEQLERRRGQVRGLVKNSNGRTLERLRSALRLRGPGLVDLFDQALEGKQDEGAKF